MLRRFRHWPWLTLQIIAANVLVIVLLATAWYLMFMRQSSVYSERLMTTFNIEPGSLHAMYVDDVERQLWISVVLGLFLAILASVGLALVIARPLRSLARGTERLRQGDYRTRSTIGSGEVGRLSDNFNALAVALEREEQRRAQFMKDLGHEFRTPIMSLQGYTEGLEDGVFRADENYFKLISEELSHLTMLTHAIEKMQLEPINLDDSLELSGESVTKQLRSATCRWQTRFSHRSLLLDVFIPKKLNDCLLALSPYLFKQITDNLLSNMYRYAPEGTECRIEVSATGERNRILLEFINEAPGVTERHLPFLFDRFYRTSASRTRVLNEHSSGLGLSVVKQICLTNGGRAGACLEGELLVISMELPIQ